MIDTHIAMNILNITGLTNKFDYFSNLKQPPINQEAA